MYEEERRDTDMGVFDPAKGQPALELKIGGNKSKITMHVIPHSPFPIHTIV